MENMHGERRKRGKLWREDDDETMRKRTWTGIQTKPNHHKNQKEKKKKKMRRRRRMRRLAQIREEVKKWRVFMQRERGERVTINFIITLSINPYPLFYLVHMQIWCLEADIFFFVSSFFLSFFLSQWWWWYGCLLVWVCVWLYTREVSWPRETRINLKSDYDLPSQPFPFFHSQFSHEALYLYAENSRVVHHRHYTACHFHSVSGESKCI